MQNGMSILKGFNMQSDLSILYILMAVVIFLALMAAIGAWARGGGLKREDAENLFTGAQERHREEISRLQKVVEESRLATEQAQSNAQQAQSRVAEAQSQAAEALKVQLQGIDSQVNRTRTDLESAVTRAAATHDEALSGKFDLVAQHLSESERRMNENVSSINGTMQSLHEQVSHAGEQMKEALMEIARQQQDQKAQGTIQMCEALITSLGTLKTSIASQLTLNAYDETPKQMVEADSHKYGTPDESKTPDDAELSDDISLSDESDESEAKTANGDNSHSEMQDSTDESVETDTSKWGDAMQLLADDEETADSEADNKADENTENDEDNNDQYPPPIY